MRDPVFTGACPALVTPFNENGAVNYDALGILIDQQINAGVDAICVAGTTGEASTLSAPEHFAVVEYCARRVNKRIKVIAGAGSNNTSTAVYLCQQAQDAGADALLLVTPYYNKTSQSGLLKHFEYIADRVVLPIILYNVPTRTGISFAAETYKILSENPIFNGIKEASGNFTLLSRTRHLCGEDFYIWSGNDDQVVPMMSLGAKGVISVVCNIMPQLIIDMTHACLNGDFITAGKLQIKYTDFIDSMFLEVNPIPIKYAMNLAGIAAGQPRLPLCEISEKNKDILKEALCRVGLLN